MPENDSTGGKVKQKGLSKKGDRYLRSLLVNGAMALVRQAKIHLRPPDKPLSTSARVWYPSLALAWRHVDCVGGMATG